MHLPLNFIIIRLLVRRLSCWQANTPTHPQTNKQTLKTSNVLRYAMTLGEHGLHGNENNLRCIPHFKLRLEFTSVVQYGYCRLLPGAVLYRQLFSSWSSRPGAKCPLRTYDAGSLRYWRLNKRCRVLGGCAVVPGPTLFWPYSLQSVRRWSGAASPQPVC